MRFLLKLAYSNLWLALGASGAAFTSARLMGVDAPASVVLCGISMFFVYTFAKAVRFDPTADFENDPERMQFLMRWRYPLISLSCLTFSAGAWWCRQDPTMLALFVYPFLGAVLYDVKWLPAFFPVRRLKDITGVKSAFVALIWGTLTVLMPAHEAGVSWQEPSVIVLVTYITLVFFINTVFFDLGDMKGDRLEGVVTLPIALGFDNTLKMLANVNLAAAALMAVSVGMGWVDPLGLRLGQLYWFNKAYMWGAHTEQTDLGFLCDVVADGVFIVAAVLVYF